MKVDVVEVHNIIGRYASLLITMSMQNQTEDPEIGFQVQERRPAKEKEGGVYKQNNEQNRNGKWRIKNSKEELCEINDRAFIF